MRKAVSQSLFFAAAAALGLYAITHESAVHAWILRAGPIGPVLSIGLYTLLASIPFLSSGAVALLNGMLFGFWWGAAYSAIAIVLSGFTTYAFAERLATGYGAEEFRAKMPVWLRRLPVGSPAFLIALRTIPWVGGTLANNAAVIYEIPFRRHFWTRLAVAVPIAAVSAYIGWKLVPGG
ncbi:MAG: TVP38/TMEM64 family protein [Candidatus Baltobacteraceae bacterium]